MASAEHWWQRLLVIVLSIALGLAGWIFYEQRPPMLAFGLGLTAAAPLAYLIYRRYRPGRERQHPVLVSIASGLGSVMVMVGIQRFGEQHQWILLPCLAILLGWMSYQRWILRRAGGPSGNTG